MIGPSSAIFINYQAFRYRTLRFGISHSLLREYFFIENELLFDLVKQYIRQRGSLNNYILPCGRVAYLWKRHSIVCDKKRKSTPKSNGKRDRQSVNTRFRGAYLSWRLVVKLLFLPPQISFSFGSELRSCELLRTICSTRSPLLGFLADSYILQLY